MVHVETFSTDFRGAQAQVRFELRLEAPTRPCPSIAGTYIEFPGSTICTRLYVFIPCVTQDTTPLRRIFKAYSGCIDESIRFRKALDERASAPPFSAPRLFLLWRSRSCAICYVTYGNLHTVCSNFTCTAVLAGPHLKNGFSSRTASHSIPKRYVSCLTLVSRYASIRKASHTLSFKPVWCLKERHRLQYPPRV